MREYMQRYRKENKEKIKQHADSYWLRKAEAMEVRSLDLEVLEAELEQLKRA
jgi:hypothetical protein